ncbi:MAG: alpha-E domain-containing protein [Gammaproteobacteria bacterium]|nr:alpha-E domain-containing protein [Gammaproteobacteria bacterium]
MIMLSRVAERLYWMARYHERAENIARLTNAYSNLLMDLPPGSSIAWDVLVKILDAEEDYAKSNRVFNENNVLKFIIADPNNPSSIINSVRGIRENVRTTRDVLPEEAWEHTNELYLYAKEFAEKSVGRRNRYAFLEQIMSRTQQINGLLLTTLSRDHAYQFIKLGHLLERADMTTRIVDVGAAEILSSKDTELAFNPSLWSTLLKALSSLTSYRLYISPIVDPRSVVNFVFKETAHPRSVIFCLRGIREELNTLKNSTSALKAIDIAIEQIIGLNSKRVSRKKLHSSIDKLQLNLGEIHNTIADNWFLKNE